jgi:hypothetical protein
MKQLQRVNFLLMLYWFVYVALSISVNARITDTKISLRLRLERLGETSELINGVYYRSLPHGLHRLSYSLLHWQVG